MRMTGASMSLRRGAVYLALAFMAGVARAADNGFHLPKGCDSIVGEAGSPALGYFDRMLRETASSGNPAAFASLIALPLRVNRDTRTTTIISRKEFLHEASGIFTPAVIKQLRNVGAACASGGVMYGNGAIWVDRRGRADYRVTVVNVGIVDPSNLPSLARPEVRLRCRGPKGVALVEDIGEGKLRYRSWSKGKGRRSKPALEIVEGTEVAEGTGPCLHSIYSFQKGDAEYSVEGLGCSPGAPKGATGLSIVRRAGKETGRWWCR